MAVAFAVDDAGFAAGAAAFEVADDTGLEEDAALAGALDLAGGFAAGFEDSPFVGAFRGGMAVVVGDGVQPPRCGCSRDS